MTLLYLKLVPFGPDTWITGKSAGTVPCFPEQRGSRSSMVPGIPQAFRLHYRKPLILPMEAEFPVGGSAKRAAVPVLLPGSPSENKD